MEYKLSKNAWVSVLPVSLTNEIPHLPTYDILNSNLKNEWVLDFLGKCEVYFEDYDSIKKIDGVISQNYNSEPVTFIDSNGNTFNGELPKINFDINGAFETEMDYLMHEMHRYLFRLYPEHKNALYTLTDAERQSYFNESLHMLNSFWDTESLPVETPEDAFYLKHKFVTNITTARKYMGSTKEEDILIHLFGIASTFTDGAIYIDDKTDTVVALRTGLRENTAFNRLYRYYTPEKISTSFQEDTFANLSDDFTSFVKDIIVSKDLSTVGPQLRTFAATTLFGEEDSIVETTVAILNNVLEYGAVDPKAGLRGTVSSSVTFENFVSDSKFYKYFTNKLNDDQLKFEYHMTLPATGGSHLIPAKGDTYTVQDVFDVEGKYIVEAVRFADLRTAKIIKMGKVVYNNEFIDWYTQLCMHFLKEAYDREPSFLNEYTGCRRLNYNYQVLFELKDSTGKVVTRSFLADEYKNNIPNMARSEFGMKKHNDDLEPSKVWSAIQDPHDCQAMHFGWGDDCTLTVSIQIYTDEIDIVQGTPATNFDTGLQKVDGVVVTSMQGIPLLLPNAFTVDWFVETGWHTKNISSELGGDIAGQVRVAETYRFKEEFTYTFNTIELVVDGVMDYYKILADALSTQVITKNSEDEQMVYFIRTYASKGLANPTTYFNNMAINTSTLSKLSTYEEDIKAEAVEMYESEVVDDDLIRSNHDITDYVEKAGRLEYMIIDSSSERHFGYIKEAYIKNTYCYMKLGECQPPIDSKAMYVKNCYLYIKGQTTEEPSIDTDEVLRTSSVTAAAYDNKYYYEVTWDKLSEDNLRWYCDSFTSDSVSEYVTESFKSHELYDPSILTEYQSLVLVSCPPSYVKPLTALLEENKSLYIDSTIKFVMHVPLIQGTTAHSREYGTISAMYTTTIPTYLSFYDIDIDRFDDFKRFVDGVEDPDMKDIEFVENIVNRSLMVWGTSIWDGNRGKEVEKLRTIWGGYLSSFIVKDLREYLPDSYKSMHALGANSSVSIKLDNYNYSANKGEIEKNWNLVYSPNPGINSTMHVDIVNLTPAELARDDNWLYSSEDDKEKRTFKLGTISGREGNLVIESTLEVSEYIPSLKTFNLLEDPFVVDLKFGNQSEASYKDYSFSVEYQSLPKYKDEQTVPCLNDSKFTLRCEKSNELYKQLRLVDNIIHVPSYWFPRTIFQVSDKTVETYLEHMVYRTWVNKNRPSDVTIEDVVDEIISYQSDCLPYICYLDEEKDIFRIAIIETTIEDLNVKFNIYDIGIPPSMVLVDKLFTDNGWGQAISECKGIKFNRSGALNKIINALAPTIYNIPAQQFKGRFDWAHLKLTDPDGNEIVMSETNPVSGKPTFADGILFDETNNTNYGAVEKKIQQGHSIKLKTDPLLGKVVTIKNPTKLITDGESDAKEMTYILQENNLYFKEYTDEVVELSAGTAVDGIQPCSIEFTSNTDDPFTAGEVLYLFDISGSVPRSVYSPEKEIQIVDREYKILNGNVVAMGKDGKSFFLVDTNVDSKATIVNAIEALTPIADYEGPVQEVNQVSINLGYKWAYPDNQIGYTYYKRKFITTGKILANDPNTVIIDDNTIIAMDHIAQGDNIEIILLDSPYKGEESRMGVSLDISFDGTTGPYKYLTSKTEQVSDGLSSTTSMKVFYVACQEGILQITYKDGVVTSELKKIERKDKESNYNYFVKSFGDNTKGEIIYASYTYEYEPRFKEVYDTETDTILNRVTSEATDILTSSSNFSPAVDAEEIDEDATETCAFLTPESEAYVVLDKTWLQNDPSAVGEIGDERTALFTNDGQTIIDLHNVSRLDATHVIATDKLDRKYLVTESDSGVGTWVDRTWIGDPSRAAEYVSASLDSGDIIKSIKNWINSMYGEADETAGASYLKIPVDSEEAGEQPTDLAYLGKVLFTDTGITAINEANKAWSDSQGATPGLTVDDAWTKGYILYPDMQKVTVSTYNNVGIDNRQCKEVQLLSKGSVSISAADEEMLADLYKALCATKVVRYINRVDAFKADKDGNRVEWDQEACTLTYWDEEGLEINRIALDEYLAIPTITPTNVFKFDEVLFNPGIVPGDDIWTTYWNAVKDVAEDGKTYVNKDLHSALAKMKADDYLANQVSKLVTKDPEADPEGYEAEVNAKTLEVMGSEDYIKLANADFDIRDFKENYYSKMLAAQYLNPQVMNSIDASSPYSIRKLYTIVRSWSLSQDDLNAEKDKAEKAMQDAAVTTVGSDLYKANATQVDAQAKFDAANSKYQELQAEYISKFSSYANLSTEVATLTASVSRYTNARDSRSTNLTNLKNAAGMNGSNILYTTAGGDDFHGNVHTIRTSIVNRLAAVTGDMNTAKAVADSNFNTLLDSIYGGGSYKGIKYYEDRYNKVRNTMGKWWSFIFEGGKAISVSNKYGYDDKYNSLKTLANSVEVSESDSGVAYYDGDKYGYSIHAHNTNQYLAKSKEITSASELQPTKIYGWRGGKVWELEARTIPTTRGSSYFWRNYYDVDSMLPNICPVIFKAVQVPGCGGMSHWNDADRQNFWTDIQAKIRYYESDDSDISNISKCEKLAGGDCFNYYAISGIDAYCVETGGSGETSGFTETDAEDIVNISPSNFGSSSCAYTYGVSAKSVREQLFEVAYYDSKLGTRDPSSWIAVANEYEDYCSKLSMSEFPATREAYLERYYDYLNKGLGVNTSVGKAMNTFHISYNDYVEAESIKSLWAGYLSTFDGHAFTYKEVTTATLDKPEAERVYEDKYFKESEYESRVKALSDLLAEAERVLADESTLLKEASGKLGKLFGDVEDWKAQVDFNKFEAEAKSTAEVLATANTNLATEQSKFNALQKSYLVANANALNASNSCPLPYPWTWAKITEDEYLDKNAAERLGVWSTLLDGANPLPSEWGTAAQLRASFEFGSTVPANGGSADWADINSYFNATVAGDGYKNSIYPDSKVLSWDTKKLPATSSKGSEITGATVTGAMRKAATDRQYLRSLVTESNIILENGKVIIYGSLKLPTDAMTSENGKIDATNKLKDVWATFCGGESVSTEILTANADSVRPFVLEVDLESGEVSVPCSYHYDNSLGNVATIKSVVNTNSNSASYTVLYQSVDDPTSYKVLRNLTSFGNIPNTILATDNNATFSSNTNLEPFKEESLFDWSSLTDNLSIATMEFLVAGAEFVRGQIAYVQPATTDMGDQVTTIGTNIDFDNVESIRVVLMVSNKEKDNFLGKYGDSESFNYIPEELSIFEVSSPDFADFAAYININDFSAVNGSRSGFFLEDSYPYVDIFGEDDVYNKHIKKFYSVPKTVKNANGKTVDNENNKPELLTNKYGHFIFRIIPVGFRLPAVSSHEEISGKVSAGFTTSGLLVNTMNPKAYFKKVDGKYYYLKEDGKEGTWTQVSADEANEITESVFVKETFGLSYSAVRKTNAVPVYKLVSDPRRALISETYREVENIAVNNMKIELKDGYIKLSTDNAIVLTGDKKWKPDDKYKVANAKYAATRIPNTDIDGEAIYIPCDGSVAISEVNIKVINKTPVLPVLKPITSFRKKGNTIATTSDEILIPRGGYGQVLLGDYQLPCTSIYKYNGEEPNFRDNIFYENGLGLYNQDDQAFKVVDPDTLQRTGVMFSNFHPVYNSFAEAHRQLPIKLASTKGIEGLLPTFLRLNRVDVSGHKITYNTMESLPDWRFRSNNKDDPASAGMVDVARLYELFLAGLTFNCKMIRKSSKPDLTNQTRIANYKAMHEDVKNHDIQIEALKTELGYTRVYAGDNIKNAPMFTRYYNKDRHQIEETGGQAIPDGDRYLCNSQGKLFRVNGYGALEVCQNDYDTGYFVFAPLDAHSNDLFEFDNIFRDFTYTNASKKFNCLYNDTGITFSNRTFEVNGLELKFVENNNFQNVYTFKPLVKCIPELETLTRPPLADLNPSVNSNSWRDGITNNYYANLSYGMDISFTTIFTKYNYLVMKDKNGKVVGTVYMKDYFDSDYVLILSNI